MVAIFFKPQNMAHKIMNLSYEAKRHGTAISNAIVHVRQHLEKANGPEQVDHFRHQITVLEEVRSLAKQAQPECEHGKTYAHTYNQPQPGDFDASVWCNGPQQAQPNGKITLPPDNKSMGSPSQQVQPEMPTREMVEALQCKDFSAEHENYCPGRGCKLNRAAVLALFAPKETT